MQKKMFSFISVLMILAMMFVAMPVSQAQAAGICVDPANTPSCYATIQAAINASTAGDTINVAAGKYVENVVVNKAISLVGAGADTTSIVATTGNSTPLVFSANNATVDGFTITHEYTTDELTSWTFNSNGVTFNQGTTGNTLQNSTVSLNRNGVYLNNSQGNSVRNSDISNNRTGFNLTNNVDNTQITGNTISGNWTLGLVYYSQGQITNFATWVVSGNTFDANWYSELLIKDAGASTGSLDISGNTFTDSPVTFTTSSSSSLNEPSFLTQKPTSLGGTATKPATDLPTLRIYNSSSASITYPGKTLFVGSDKTYLTIQSAIDAAGSGDIVVVDAGTYTEDLIVNKPLTLLGANAEINPNTGTRGAETILQPATSNPNPSSSTYTVGTYVGASNVTIKGFTFDGDNPALTSGISIGSADVDAAELIAGWDGVGGIDIENNIFKNSTYSAVDFYNYSNDAATANNYIRFNKFENLGESTYNYGIGVLVYNNFYADITDNVFNNVRTGIQTGNFYRANPGTTGTINNNVLNVWRVGIFHNLWYSNASKIVISNNTINAVAHSGATKWNGILISSFQSAVDTLVKDNTINIPAAVTAGLTDYVAGINVWNTPTTAALTISGGTITGGKYGIFVNNFEGYASNAGNTSITINGVTTSDATIAGIYVKDSPSNTNGSKVSANVLNTVVTGAPISVLVEGADANAVVTHSKIASFTNTNSAEQAGEENWWGSLVGPATGAISGSVDYTPWCLNESCTLFGPVDGKLILPDGVSADVIQQAIDNAPANITIVIPAGTYNFSGGYHVDNAHLTLYLKNGVIIQNSSPCFDVNASFTTITTESAGGAKCVPTNGANGINVATGLQNIIIQGLDIDGSAQTTGDGIHFAGAITDVQVLDNYVHALDGNGLAFTSTPAGVVDIQGNLFKANTGFGVSAPADVNVRYNSWGDYAGPSGTNGDGVASAITSFSPWTYASSSMQSSGTPWSNQVLPGYDITYTVYADLQSVEGATVSVTIPAGMTYVGTNCVANQCSGAFDVESVTKTGALLTYVGVNTTSPAVGGQAKALFTYTMTGVSGSNLLAYDAANTAFAMAPAAGPTNNIYTTQLSDGVVNVISALPTMSTTGLDVPFTVGHTQEFSLIINNPLAGVAYSNPQVRFTLPAGTTLEYNNGGTWVTVSSGTLDLAALAASGTDVTVPLRVTFGSPASVAFSASLYDTVEVTPDALLATTSTSIDVRATASLTGTFSMQGRTTRAGVPVTLTGALFGVFNGSSIEQMSNNLVITGLTSYDTYTLTTNQPRYLNVTSALAKTVAGDKGTMAALELKGGNAVWTDNVIDVLDASQVGHDWGVTGNGDVNFSGKADIFDLAIVGGNYNLTSAAAYGTWVP